MWIEIRTCNQTDASVMSYRASGMWIELWYGRNSIISYPVIPRERYVDGNWFKHVEVITRQVIPRERYVDWNLCIIKLLMMCLSHTARAVRGLKYSEIEGSDKRYSCRIAHAVRGLKSHSVVGVTTSNCRIAHAVCGLKCQNYMN